MPENIGTEMFTHVCITVFAVTVQKIQKTINLFSTHCVIYSWKEKALFSS